MPHSKIKCCNDYCNNLTRPHPNRKSMQCRDCWNKNRKKVREKCAKEGCENKVKRLNKYCSPECFYSIPASEEKRQKASQFHKGKILSDETKKKMSEWQKGEKNNRWGKKNSSWQTAQIVKSIKGIPKSEETRKRMSEAAVKRVQNNKHYSSKSELLFVQLIEERYDVKLETQFRIENGAYDIKYKNHLIEIDGIYWHSTEEAKVRDKNKDELAKNNGYILHRIPITELKDIPKIFEANIELLDEVFKDDMRDIPDVFMDEAYINWKDIKYPDYTNSLPNSLPNELLH